MTVVIRIRGTDKNIEVEDVVNFKMNTAHFWLELKGDNYRTFWRRNVELVRIKERDRKMTDEEMAKKYAEKQNLQNVNPSGIVRCKLADAFLAGLKAGRPQWHDLRKDPNDLPKEYDIIRKAFGIYEEEKAKHIVQNECGERVFCFNGTWYHEKGGEAHPIAWCEIPIFDKE